MITRILYIYIYIYTYTVHPQNLYKYLRNVHDNNYITT